MRAAEAERHAEALGDAHGDVGAELAGRARAGSGPAGRRRRRPARRARGRSSTSGRRSRTAPDDARVLAAARRSSSPAGSPSARSATTHLDAERLGPGAQHGDASAGGVSASTRNTALGAPCSARRQQRHGLGGGGGLVEQRGVGHGQAGEVGDHRLEVQQRLEPALADLRLVRRVGGVPGRVLQHVAPDHRRGDGAVVAEPDHRDGDACCGRRARAARRAPRSRCAAGGSVEAGLGVADGGGHGRGRPARRATATPMAASISASSSGRGPMCRSANGGAALELGERRAGRSRRASGGLGRRGRRPPPLSCPCESGA